MIHFKDVSFAYKEGKWAVRHINFTVNKGEFVSIIGGNGSGKSTIARLSDGLLLPQEGSVFVDEMNSHAKKDEFLIKEKVGVVFQNPDNQFVGTTVEEDIAFGLENIGIERVEAKARIKQISSLLGIDKYLHGSPSYLSDGEKQKVAIASVLVMQPDYLVMDEITALLDPVSRKEVLNLVHSIVENKNIGVLYITHITEEVIKSDKVLVLHKGEKIKEGAPAVILQDMKLLNSAGVASLPSVIISEELRKHGIIDNSFVDEEDLVDLLCSN